MRRYEDIKTKIDEKRNKKVYKTMLFPKIEKHIDDIYIRTLASDRLDSIAFSYYDDVTLWWVIAQANNIGKGSMQVEPGTILQIPNQNRIASILTDLNNLNKDRM
jgi:hypothetical protein